MASKRSSSGSQQRRLRNRNKAKPQSKKVLETSVVQTPEKVRVIEGKKLSSPCPSELHKDFMSSVSAVKNFENAAEGCLNRLKSRCAVGCALPSPADSSLCASSPSFDEQSCHVDKTSFSDAAVEEKVNLGDIGSSCSPASEHSSCSSMQHPGKVSVPTEVFVPNVSGGSNSRNEMMSGENASTAHNSVKCNRLKGHSRVRWGSTLPTPRKIPKCGRCTIICSSSTLTHGTEWRTLGCSNPRPYMAPMETDRYLWDRRLAFRNPISKPRPILITTSVSKILDPLFEKGLLIG